MCSRSPGETAAAGLTSRCQLCLCSQHSFPKVLQKVCSPYLQQPRQRGSLVQPSLQRDRQSKAGCDVSSCRDSSLLGDSHHQGWLQHHALNRLAVLKAEICLPTDPVGCVFPYSGLEDEFTTNLLEAKPTIEADEKTSCASAGGNNPSRFLQVTGNPKAWD